MNPFGGGSGPFGSPSGGVAPPWENLRLIDFVQFNTGTYLASAVVDNGGSAGWSIPLLGGVGKDVTDPFAGWHAISATPLTDWRGTALSQVAEWVKWLGLHEVSGVTASADIDIVIGLCNGPVDGGANDWIGCGFRLAATRTGITVQGTDGTNTTTAGGALATIRRLRFPIVKVGTVTSSLVRPVVRFQDASNVALGTANIGSITAGTATTYEAGGGLGWADAPPHLFIAAYRTTATDTTTRTPCYQPLDVAPIALSVPV